MVDNVRYLGGFTPPKHGSVLGFDVTAAFGWGVYAGEVLYATGHVRPNEFVENYQRVGGAVTPLPPLNPSGPEVPLA